MDTGIVLDKGIVKDTGTTWIQGNSDITEYTDTGIQYWIQE